jgi:FAD synthase
MFSTHFPIRSRTGCAGSRIYRRSSSRPSRSDKSGQKDCQKAKFEIGSHDFFPHPKQIIGNDQTPQTYITPLEQKAKLMQDLGVDTLIVVNFNSAFAHLSPSDFIEYYLCGF